jgi:hypothetical protein
MMDPTPSAVIEQAPESEADFRRWVRDEFKFWREVHRKHGETLELILATLKKDEDDHG